MSSAAHKAEPVTWFPAGPVSVIPLYPCSARQREYSSIGFDAHLKDGGFTVNALAVCETGRSELEAVQLQSAVEKEVS